MMVQNYEAMIYVYESKNNNHRCNSYIMSIIYDNGDEATVDMQLILVMYWMQNGEYIVVVSVFMDP